MLALIMIAWYSVFKLVTFLPADCEDGQIFICGIFWAFGIGGGIFWGCFGHCMLAFLWNLPMALFEICVHFLTFLSNRAL